MASTMQIVKSKTNQATAIVAGVLSILPAFGVQVPQEAAVGIMALLAFVMRLITKEPLSEK